MGRGDMNLCDIERGAPREISSVRQGSYVQVLRLSAIAFLLLGEMLLPAAPGVSKDRTPKTKTVSGVVFDDAENAVVGAMVELKDLQTGKVLDVYSQQGGKYQYENLRFDHDYTVVATYKGTSSEVRQVSSIDTRWYPVLNLVVPNANK
jgi:hypothetical protein